MPDLGKGTGLRHSLSGALHRASSPPPPTASMLPEPLPPPKIEHLPSHIYTDPAEAKVRALSPSPLASAFCSGSLLRASIPSHTRDLHLVTSCLPAELSSSEPGRSNGAPWKGWAKLVLERQKAGSLKNSEKWEALCPGELGRGTG